MTFAPAKGLLAGLIIWGSITLLALISFWDFYEDGLIDRMFLQVINATIILLLLWIWFGTTYKIDKNIFYYKSGPIKGSLPVKSIRKLIINKNMWSGTKIALASKGIIIQYNKWDELYISPQDKEAFISALLAINNAIVVAE